MSDMIGTRLGILMLDSHFPRIPGDVGNPATWPFPVRYSVVPGATPGAIVQGDPEPFVEEFIEAGQTLVDAGCDGIATTCGFLAPLRPRLSEALGVPVAASALEQAAQIRAMLPPERTVGILTISAAALGHAHLTAASVPPDSVIAGVEETRFARTILGDLPHLDVGLARVEMVLAAKELVARAPQIGSILLECTNMVPYAPDIARETGRAVFSIDTYLRWFHAGLSPRSFPAP